MYAMRSSWPFGFCRRASSASSTASAYRSCRCRKVEASTRYGPAEMARKAAAAAEQPILKVKLDADRPVEKDVQDHELDRTCAVAERDRCSDVDAEPEHDRPLTPEAITDPNREKRTAQCHELYDGHGIAIEPVVHARVLTELRQIGPDTALTGLVDEQCEHRGHGDSLSLRAAGYPPGRT